MRRSAVLAAFILVCTLVLAAAVADGRPIKFARYPNAGHGKMAFTYHGDIWVANLDGSGPVRLTDHVAMDTFPRFSPDGKWVAFNSNRMGNLDVWIIPAAGGEARQLTFHSVNDEVQYWTPDGKGVVFATTRGTNPWGSPLHVAPIDGGLPAPIPGIDAARAGMMSPDGAMIAFNREGLTYWRKHYSGNNQTNVWLQDVKTRKVTRLTDLDPQQYRQHVQDAYPMWGADGFIYFLSERDGFFNIWKISPRGGQPAQVTFHKLDGVQFPSISADGRLITYENEFDLWKLDVPDGKPQRIALDLDFDTKKNLVEFLPANNVADNFHPSPAGDYVAVDFHGEIFIVPAEAGIGEAKQVTASSWRDRYARWAPDGTRLAYISDETLEEEIWLYDAAAGTRKKVTALEATKTPPVWADTSKQFAFVAANTLYIYDLDQDKVARVAYNEAGGFAVNGFSKDGRWVVATRNDVEQNADVFLIAVADGREVNLTANPFRDGSGTLTPDGRHLVFTSTRADGVNHLYVVSLRRVTENPDDPLVRERLKKQKAEMKKAETGSAQAVPEVTVDTDRIGRRAVQITKGTNPVGSYFLSDDGKTVYYTSTDDKGPGLFAVDLDGRNARKHVDGEFPGLVPTADRKMVFYRQQNNVHRMALADKKKEPVRFDFRVRVDKRVEWEQMFEEAWRVMKYRFYDETMHGYDWQAMRARYKPLLQYVGENQDVYDLANEMIGELDASHTGVSGPSGIDIPPTYTTRLLGFEMVPDQGAWRVSHIYRDGPADKEWVDLKVGDLVVALNGRELKGGENYWRALNELVTDFVTVTVASSPAKTGERRNVRIETVTSLRDVQYEEWVETCRAYVEKESKGRIGYVHIRAMNQPSLQRFRNEIDQLWDKDGIVIDIRYNGGGNIDEPLLDILERRPYAFVNFRGSAKNWGRRHRQAVAGPKVMLVNQRSFSDAEMTPAGFRVLGLGRIVGMPTGGGVIWTGSYQLINGGSIRTPSSLAITYDATRPNKYGINLENYGVPPDVYVENAPEDVLAGNDRELKAAVDEVRRMIKEGTATTR